MTVSGKAGGLSHTFDVERYYVLGGVLGAAYLFTALVTVSSIGAGGVAAATITGQLVASVALDRLGVLGLEETPLTIERVIGVVLLLAGTYLVVRQIVTIGTDPGAVRSARRDPRRWSRMRSIGSLGSALVALAVGLLVLFVFFVALGAFSPAETIIVSVVAVVAAVALGIHMFRVHRAMNEGHGSDFHRSLNMLRERRGF